MIILGLILLLIGFFIGNRPCELIGAVLVGVGLILLLLHSSFALGPLLY